HAMLLADEGDIIDDEDAGLADGGEIGDDLLRAAQAIGAAIEGPGAAEGAVPGTAARELDRGTGIERAEEIFAAMAQQVACRAQRVETLDEGGRRALAREADGSGHLDR